jgi:hypothetical protein
MSAADNSSCKHKAPPAAKKGKKAKQTSGDTTDQEVEEDIVSIEARALLSTGSIRTSSQAFIRNQFLHVDEALQEFQEKVNQYKLSKE